MSRSAQRESRGAVAGPSSSSYAQSAMASTSRGGGGGGGDPSTGGGGGPSEAGRYPTQTINQKAALASAYNELGKELGSTRLKAIGNYTLGRTIGQGTFGKVRLGTHRLTGTRVAIKQIPKAHSASLTREIHHHRRLHHAHVMKLYEVLATESNIWMISELCSGGELYDYLVERGTLSEAEARRVFGQLCLAVSYVHGRGIVHRDLKLENVLLDERCNVKLGDFGFTREYEGRRLMETFCGTTGYAAPEMLAGKKYTGQEVDIWSLGIILYALLCGSLPFDDDDETVMKMKILQGDFELPETLSEEARSLVSNILRKEPTERLSIRAILGHPWFTKIIPTGSMQTVEENGRSEGESQPWQSKATLAYTASSRPVSPRSTAPSLPTDQEHSSEPKRPQTEATASGVSLTISMANNASASSSSLVDGDNPTSDSSDTSDYRSGVSGATAPTSIEDSGKSGSGSRSDGHEGAMADGTLSQEDTPRVGRETVTCRDPAQHRPIGMQHRNESQSTIRRNGSSGSEGGMSRQSVCKTVKGGGGTSNLPTHHESPGRSSSADSTHADEDETRDVSYPHGAEGRRSQEALLSASHLFPGDSTSPSRIHRTPSRTKRRSVSSAGLSDHHPPHLDQTRPIDYLSLLEASQPALFSSPLEQELLHQVSNLGMDVGQIVHSILTDACDASAAMWWLLRRKAEERKAVEKALFPVGGFSPMMPTSTVPSPKQGPAPALPTGLVSLGHLSSDLRPPAVPEKPNARPRSQGDLPSQSGTALPGSPPLLDTGAFELEGLPQSAQESFRRRQISAGTGGQEYGATLLSTIQPSKMTPAEPIREPGSQAQLQPRRAQSPPPSTMTTLLTSPSPSRPAIKARSSSAIPDTNNGASPRGKADPAGEVMSSPTNNRRSSGGRQPASSIGLKLSNALTSGIRKESVANDEPESPLPPLASGYEKGRGPALSTGLGLFGRRASGGVKKPKNAREQMGTTPFDLSSEDLTSRDSGAGDRAMIRVRDSTMERRQSSTPNSSKSGRRDQSPTRSPSVNTNRTGSPGSSRQLPTSNSADTFSSVHTGPANVSIDQLSSTHDTADSSLQSIGSNAKKSKGRGKSSFLTTVRTWLGTEEKTKDTSGARNAGTSSQTSAAARKKKGSGATPHAHLSPETLATRPHAAAPGGATRSPSMRSRSGQFPASGSIARRGSKRSPAPSRTYQMSRGPSISRPPSVHGHSQGHGHDTSSPGTSLLGQTPHASSPYTSNLARPTYYRRQSAGSITPTATLYGGAGGERPSRAPSNSSLYRTPLATGAGMRTRRGSSSSAHSMMLRRQQGSSSHFYPAALAQSGSATGRPYSPFADRIGEGTLRRGASRRSVDSGTIVRRQRGSIHRRGSETHHSRPSSLIEVAADRELVPESDGIGSGMHSPGVMTPRRPSVDSRREGDSSHGHGRISPTIFLAHRTRQSYKPPSANPALFHHAHSARSPSLSRNNSAVFTASVAAPTVAPPLEARDSSTRPQSQNLPLAGTGTWQRSWGRPPPSWAGPVDPGLSSSELSSARSGPRSGLPSAGGGGGSKAGLRDVFADKDEDDWEDEDDGEGEATFSGGLGQLDSTRLHHHHQATSAGMAGGGWRNSRNMDSPIRGPRGATGGAGGMGPWGMRAFVGSGDMRRVDSGPGAGKQQLMPAAAPVAASASSGRRSPLPSSFTGTGTAGAGGGSNSGSSGGGYAPPHTSNSLLSNTSRYAGVRNVFQPPALGRETRPRMIAVCEGEDDDEDASRDEVGGMLPRGGEAAAARAGAKVVEESSEEKTSLAPAPAPGTDKEEAAGPTPVPTTSTSATTPALAPPLTGSAGGAVAAANTTSRIGGSVPPSFKSNIVEEEEEEEEEE